MQMVFHIYKGGAGMYQHVYACNEGHICMANTAPAGHSVDIVCIPPSCSFSLRY
jgi:hypothetical protein